MTDASLMYLLRTMLAKSGKDPQRSAPLTLEPLKDTIRLKKHIASVLDRLSKGVQLNEKKEENREKSEYLSHILSMVLFHM